MPILYLAALVIGIGSVAVQLLGTGDSNGDAHAGGDHGGAESHDGHGEAGFLPIFLSLRFWTHGLLAFGIVGTTLHYLNLAGRTATLVSALAIGLFSGLLAAWVLRALARADTSSGAEAHDSVGQVGRVLVGCRRGGHAKVRIELRGQTLDLLATTDDEELESGAPVLVEEVRGTTLHVSRAPDEFKAGNRG